MNKSVHISFIGAGNIATQLALAFHRYNVIIDSIYGPTKSHVELLAEQVHAKAICELSAINSDSDFYFLCVPDNAIKEVISKMKVAKEAVIVHCAGSVHLNVFSTSFEHFGVFYPFQTFTKNKQIDFNKVNIFCEANSPEILGKILDLAKIISHHVLVLDSNQRLNLHLAAVMSCNFTNHLLALTYKICDENKLDFKYILPLIHETLQKAENGDPQINQTGPAIRGDHSTIEKHKELLETKPVLKNIYETLTYSIQLTKNKNEL